jgi:hypothetical protein
MLSRTEQKGASMKNVLRVSTIVILVLFASVSLRAQEHAKASTSQSATPVTQFRIDLVLTEFDGAKKISRLPYTLNETSSDFHSRTRSGVRVPVMSGTQSGGTEYQYIDLGTNIDCQVEKPSADGRYPVDVTVGRSSLYAPAGTAASNNWSLGGLPKAEPTVHSFLSSFSVLLRDGQTQEATSVTDPLTGHVIKVTVTLHVIK